MGGFIMEDKKDVQVAKPSTADVYKAKYGKIYRVTATIEPDDVTAINLEYFFKKPTTASYDRYIKTAAQSPTKAIRAFIQDNVVEELLPVLENDLDEYPALALSVGEKLLSMMGLSKDVNLRLL